MKNLKFNMTLTLIFTLANLSTSALPQEKEVLLFEEWYQIIINKKDKIAYYSDRVSKVGKHIRFKHSLWKNEEGYMNREELSSFSEDNKELTPAFFNLFEKYRESETTTDGTFQNSNTIHITVKKLGEKPNKIEKNTRKNSIFSLFFPLWIAKNMDSMKGSTAHSVNVFVEDGKTSPSRQESATATLVPQDDFAKKTDSHKFIIKFLGQESTWWLKKNGMLEKIEMPAKNAEVIRVNATEAQKTFIQK